MKMCIDGIDVFQLAAGRVMRCDPTRAQTAKCQTLESFQQQAHPNILGALVMLQLSPCPSLDRPTDCFWSENTSTPNKHLGQSSKGESGTTLHWWLGYLNAPYGSKATWESEPSKIRLLACCNFSVLSAARTSPMFLCLLSRFLLAKSSL